MWWGQEAGGELYLTMHRQHVGDFCTKVGSNEIRLNTSFIVRAGESLKILFISRNCRREKRAEAEWCCCCQRTWTVLVLSEDMNGDGTVSEDMDGDGTM